MNSIYGQDIANITNISSFVLFLFLIAAILVYFLPKRYSIIPFVIMASFIPLGQRIVVAGFDFTIIRLLIVVGIARLIFRNELLSIKINTIDVIFFVFQATQILAFTILWGTSDAFINRLGRVYEASGIYIFFRVHLQSVQDIKIVLISIFAVSLPMASFMFVEWITAKNIFYVLGGVPEFTSIREGELRCRGPFRHPILAGTFGAVILPFFISIVTLNYKYKTFGILGIISANIIVFTSGSSGPLLALLIGSFSTSLWLLRAFRKQFKLVIFLGLIILQSIMSQPVWFVFARISGYFTGGTGWHRSILIDKTIENFSDWWLYGTKSTISWGYGLYDITNQYISYGLNGGFINFLLFIAIIVLLFRILGNCLDKVDNNNKLNFFIWCIGSTLIAHSASFFSVTYFDQIQIYWYQLVALIASLPVSLYKYQLFKFIKSEHKNDTTTFPKSVINSTN